MSTYHERLRLIKLDKLPKEAVAKPKKGLKKISDKKRAELKAEDIDSKLDCWFIERRKEMVGKCVLCGGKTEKKNDETYRRSIHHILDKRKGMFPSVQTHPSNWLEVCFWGNSCHTNLHNKTITWELLFDSKEWIIIERKLKDFLPFIHPSEMKNLPSVIIKHFNLGEK